MYNIAWHEECLRNQSEHHARELVLLQSQQDRVDRLAKSISEYREQIDLAVRKRKTHFDREKFNRKKS